jgi:hypothetical protein
VIIAAYSNANPQVAAAWSANLTTWGSGNTYTNECANFLRTSIFAHLISQTILHRDSAEPVRGTHLQQHAREPSR